MSVTIRPAQPAHARGIARVHVESWRTTYREALPKEFLQNLSIDEREQHWSRHLLDPRPGSFIIIAVDENEHVVGFSSGGNERSGENVYDGEIYALYLLQEYQRMGIGRKLVEASIEQMIAQGMTSMLIWVLRENPSRLFYETMGGVPVDEKTITIGGVDMVDVAYGWRELGGGRA